MTLDADAAELPGYSILPEPELVFGRSRTDKHPLVGLINYGPYGERYGTPDTLRLALLAPRGELSKLQHLITELKRPVRPREAINYYPEYPGFREVF